MSYPVWTRDRINAAVEILGRHTLRDFGRATMEIAELVGGEVSGDALYAAFRRHGLGPPTSFCRSPGPAPVELEGPATDRAPSKLAALLLIPDVHRPYHDARAWTLMLEAARRLRPETIVVLGDFLDCYSVSSHDRDPSRARSLASEVADANAGLDDLDSIGAAQRHFVAGNHEDRLSRYLMQKAPELFGMVKIDELLHLKERGWTFTPYKQSLRVGKLNVTHDCGNAGPYAHIKAREAFESNAIIGHTHRAAVHYAGNAKGESHVGAMFGWLGDVEQIDYMHRVSALRAWQLGFGVGHMERESGVVHLQAVPIVNYRLVLNGELIQG